LAQHFGWSPAQLLDMTDLEVGWWAEGLAALLKEQRG